MAHRARLPAWGHATERPSPPRDWHHRPRSHGGGRGGVHHGAVTHANEDGHTGDGNAPARAARYRLVETASREFPCPPGGTTGFRHRGVLWEGTTLLP